MGSTLSLLISSTTLVVTVVYYYRMVILTELTTEASLFNTLYAEYTTSDMMNAVRAVEEYAHDSKLLYRDILCASNDNNRPWDRKFDQEWQRLYHWYQKLVYFHRLGLLSERFCQEFPGKIRTRHFVESVEPFALNSCYQYQEKNCTDVFDYLRELYTLPERKEITCSDEIKPKKTESKRKESKEEL